MKKITSLIIAVTCVAIMIGGWAWLIGISSEPGSYVIGLVPPMIITTIGLFIAAMILIGKFFKSFRMYNPSGLSEKKKRIALAGAVVQIAIIVAAAIWLICSPFGIIFSLPAFAVFTGLSQGASLCIKIFRGEPIGVAPQQPQNYVPDSIVEPPQNFIAEKNSVAACGTKNYRALAGAMLRGAAIVGMWIWYIRVGKHSSGMGGLGISPIFPTVYVFSVVLFVGALLRISDYNLSVKWTSGDVTAVTPQVKSRKNPVSIAVQSVLIFASAALLVGLIGFLNSLAIIVVFVVLKIVDK